MYFFMGMCVFMGWPEDQLMVNKYIFLLQSALNFSVKDKKPRRVYKITSFSIFSTCLFNWLDRTFNL